MRRLSTLAGLSVTGVLVTCLAAPPATAATAGSGAKGADNLVVALASGDGRHVVERSSVVVTTANGRTVDNQNVARAESRDCTGCRAIAVAFQAVLVPGEPAVVEPGNGAAAFNVNCTACTTAAFAYQYVVSTNGAKRLDAAGQERVERVARKVQQVTRSGLSPAELDAQLEQLEGEFRAAVDAGLAAGRERSEKDDDADGGGRRPRYLSGT